MRQLNLRAIISPNSKILEKIANNSIGYYKHSVWLKIKLILNIVILSLMQNIDPY